MCFTTRHIRVLLILATACFNQAAAITLTSQHIQAEGHSTILHVPEGMEVEYMGSMDRPRFLELGPDNELLIGSDNSSVYRWRPPYSAAELLVQIPGRNHSLAYRSGELFVAETGGLYRAAYSGLTTNLETSDFKKYLALPSQEGGHWSRTVMVGPDDALYVGLGISGNCSNEYLHASYPFERRRGGVFRLSEVAGAAPRLVPFASGLRNPIGLAFNLTSNKLYATNAGSDDIGFDQPREVFAHLSQNSFHGMPWFQYINGAFQEQSCISTDSPRAAAEARPPAITFDARSTPEGVAFVYNNALSPDFSGNAIVAIHGSWAKPSGGGNENRRPPKLLMIEFSAGKPSKLVNLVTGFQRADGSRFARPVGVLAGPDGHIYFTSDGGDVLGLFRLKRSNWVNMMPMLFPVLSD